MKYLLPAAFLAALCAAQTPALADDDRFDDRDDARKSSVAVFGDWPYSKKLFDNAKLLIDSINNDADVSLAIHLGDIHSGSAPCTGAGFLPPLASSDPGWNQKIFSFFQQIKTPLVYTPGDNEWTDCHRTASSPLNELDAIRTLFFSRPGHTLGLNDRKVFTQAEKFDPSFPSDGKYVENVIWTQSRVLFVTVNMPGSNNDKLRWTGFDPAAPADLSLAHQTEIAERTAAATRWLDAAFRLAMRYQLKGVVIGLQADMWDPTALPSAGGDGLDGYTPFVNHLADLSVSFGRPVLVLNGDSHKFGSDKPLADPTQGPGLIHHTRPVPNLTRVTVQGSTSNPAEWLKLTIDPSAGGLFSWKNVAYCNAPNDPTKSCQ